PGTIATSVSAAVRSAARPAARDRQRRRPPRPCRSVPLPRRARDLARAPRLLHHAGVPRDAPPGARSDDRGPARLSNGDAESTARLEVPSSPACRRHANADGHRAPAVEPLDRDPAGRRVRVDPPAGDREGAEWRTDGLDPAAALLPQSAARPGRPRSANGTEARCVARRTSGLHLAGQMRGHPGRSPCDDRRLPGCERPGRRPCSAWKRLRPHLLHRPGTDGGAAAERADAPDGRERAALDLRDLGDETALVLDVRVPGLEAGLELVQLVAAPLQADGLARVRADAVLVPGQLPGDGDRELAGAAGERHDARRRLPEALGDAADGAPVGTRVEEVGGLEQRDLVLGQATEDRLLLREPLLVARAAQAEQLGEAPLAAALAADRRRRRRALPDPARLDGDVLAERAHVDELGSLGGREAY